MTVADRPHSESQAPDLTAYRNSEQDRVRIGSLLRLLPNERTSVLDIGARDGHVARLLCTRVRSVVAMDIVTPGFRIPGVGLVTGDVSKMPFATDSIDTVMCSEVLEHIPPGLLARAAEEIARVAKRDVIIGVPYRQDTRVGETTCTSCGSHNPPYGHVNTFDDSTLDRLFSALRRAETDHVWVDVKPSTNALSAALLRLAGNPWGTYDQEERCFHCGARLAPPVRRTLFRRVCGAVAVAVQRVQTMLAPRREAYWVHVRYEKRNSAQSSTARRKSLTPPN